MTKPTWLPAWINVKNVLIFGLGSALIILAWLSYWKPEPADTAQLLSDMQKKIEAKLKKDIEDRDVKIKDLTNRVVVSNGIISGLRKKVAEVKNEPVKEPPKTNKELRDRFIALGFPPK